MKRLDLIYVKALAGAWEEALEEFKELPYYDHSLETDLNVMRSIHQRIRSPKGGKVKVVARKKASGLDINSEVWGVEGEDEYPKDYYYMGFDIYGIYPEDVEDKGINLLAALFYDERMDPNTDKEDLEEINTMIEENREMIEIYREMRKEGMGPEEARKKAIQEVYRRRAEKEGFEELPF